MEIHIVGLGVDYKNAELLKACDRFRADRDARGIRICTYLQGQGIDIHYENVKAIANGANLGRPHFARFLIERGYVAEKKEAFHRYLDTEEFHKAVDRVLPDPEESINLIHGAGGLAVLAHPGLYEVSYDELEGIVNRCYSFDLDGIECYYSKHSEEDTVRFPAITEKYELLISGGSDYHGENVKPGIDLGMNIATEYLTILKKMEAGRNVKW